MATDDQHRLAEILEHTGWLRSLARQLVRDPHTADDVVQSTLMAALAWDGEPREGLRNWLAGVARNMARQIARGESRRRQRQIQAALPEALPSAGEMVELVESQRWLAGAVLKLDEPYRSTVFLRYYEDLQPKEIAARLGLPASTVRVRLKRGLGLLRERLDRGAKDEQQHWSLMLLPLVQASRGSGLPPSAGPAVPSWLTRLGGLRTVSLLLVVLSSSALLYFNSNPLTGAPASAVHESDQGTPARLETSMVKVGSEQRVAGGQPSLAEARLPQPAGCCLVGRVLDADAAPLPGARVTAVEASQRSPSILEFVGDQPWTGETTSDAEGIYRIPVEPDRPYLIRAQYAGLAPTQSPVTFPGELRDIVLGEGQAVSIQVNEYNTRQPLADVSVSLHSADAFRIPANWEMQAQTDAAGHAQLSHLPAGAYRGTLELEGYATLAIEGHIAAQGSTVIVQQLSPAMDVQGVVLDGKTLEPVLGVSVEGPQGTALTDHRGQFTLHGFNPQAKRAERLLVNASGHSPLARYIKVDPALGSLFIELRLPRAVHVVGRVLDPQGRPIAGARVGHQGRFMSNPTRAERHDGEVQSDQLGRFELALHHRAQYTIGAQAPGFAMAHTRLRNTNVDEWQRDVGDLVLHRGGSIEGFVRKRGKNRLTPDTIEVKWLFEGEFRGSPPLLVRIVPVTSGGRFRVSDLAPGSYGLSLHGADPSGRRPTIVLARRTVKVAAGVKQHNIELIAAPPIAGRVLWPDGSPGQYVHVSLHQAREEPSLAFTLADAQGLFRLVPEGRGPFVIVAADHGLRADAAVARNVMAGTQEIELRLKPRHTPYRVHGKLLAEHNQPIEGLTLSVAGETSGEILARVIVVAPDGSFEIDNLDPEPYTLRAYSIDGSLEFAPLYGIAPDGRERVLHIEALP